MYICFKVFPTIKNVQKKLLVLTKAKKIVFTLSASDCCFLTLFTNKFWV